MVKKRLAWLLGTGALVLLLLWTVLAVGFLPLVEKGLERLVARSLPDQPFSCTVRRLGLSGAELEAIVLGNPEKPALRIDSLQLSYSLAGLLSRHVERLALEGLQIHGAWLDGRFVPDGFSTDEGAAKPSEQAGFSLPGTVGQLSINRGLLRYGVDGRMEQWPFRLQLGQENHQEGGDPAALMSGSLILQPEGQEVAVTFRAAVEDRGLSFKVGTSDFPLIFLAAFLGQELTGRLHLAAEGRVGLNPFAVSSVDLDCEIDQFALRGENNSWLLQAAGAGDAPPLLAALTVAHGKWQLESTGLALRSPVEVMVSEVKGEGLLADDGVSPASGSLQFGRIVLNGQDLGGLLLTANQQAEGVLFTGSHKSKVLEGVSFKIKGEAGHSPVHGLSGSVQLSAPSQTFTAFNLGSFVKAKQEVALAGELGLQASLVFAGGKKSGDLQLQLDNTRLELPASEVVVSGLKLSLALPDLSPASASLQLARIVLNGQDLGGLLLTANQQAEGVLFTGSHKSKVLEGVSFKIKGEAGHSPVHGLSGSVQLSAPRQTFTAFNLGRFVKAKQEVTLAGELGLQASLVFAGGEKSGDLQLQLDNTRLELPASEVVVSGLKLSLALPDLFQQRSLPAQPLSFAAVNVGNLAFVDGKVVFQLESPTSLLLESAVLGWCDGHVSTESLRLSTSRQDYEMMLLCDRVSLACLFAQLGVQRVEGEGVLNGRIPMAVVDGRLGFADGLLSSPPGEGGKIRMRDIGLLTAGVPKESPQFAQMDFVGEALKDFNYNSARLLVNTEGSDLLLQVKLDGQPVHPLPFSFDSQTGSFTRLQDKEQGGISHPIHLEMNLRLPLETIMEYSGGMQRLYEMTR